MRGIRMIKWGGSDGGQCPAVYVADDVEGLADLSFEAGGFLIQGTALPPGVLAQLQELAEHETAVWVPATLLHEDLPALLAQIARQPLK